MPPLESIVFLSERPYVPRGSLRDALTLSAQSKQTDSELGEILRRVGLGHLSHSVDRIERWDHELTIGDLHRLSYARLLLIEPQWVISDDGLDMLISENNQEGPPDGILSIFQNELAGASVVSFATRSTAGDFYGRHIHLEGPDVLSKKLVRSFERAPSSLDRDRLSRTEQ